MGSAGHSQAELEQVIRLIEEALQDGFCPPNRGKDGAIAAAARKAQESGLVKTHKAFRSRVEAARQRHREPDWTLWRPPVYTRASPETVIDPYRLMEASIPTGKRVTVCVIGDMHDDPRMDSKDRFLWIGRWIASEAPDYVVQIGDWATFDSMSRHHERGSKEAQLAPSWPHDLESLYLSLGAMQKGMGGRGHAKFVITEGNHEKRVARYENANPNVGNALSVQWKGAVREHGWNVRPFGEYYFIEGVGFIHHPINGAGKAFGGETGNQRAGAKATFPIVHGHDHKREVISVSKIGPSPEVSVLSVGCSLPWGWVEEYAMHAATGWWWGVTKLWIQDGMITDVSFTSMLEVEARFSG